VPLGNRDQPEMIVVNDFLRLRKFDEDYAAMLSGYQDPYVYQNSEGIFDDAQKPDLDYVKRMYDYLSEAGEFYVIEVKENEKFVPVGDVTIKPENPPIAIWQERYRGQGIGLAVMETMIKRLKMLGFEKISGSTVFQWNIPSQKLHEKLGFCRAGETEEEIFYELVL